MERESKGFTECKLPSDTYTVKYKIGAPIFPSDLIGADIILSRERLANAFTNMGALIVSNWVCPPVGGPEMPIEERMDAGSIWEQVYLSIYKVLDPIFVEDMVKSSPRTFKIVQAFLKMVCGGNANKEQPTILDFIKEEAS